MRFNILGQLELRADGRTTYVRASKHRTLLTALLLRPGSLVRLDSLAAALWPAGPPASGVANIRTYVRELRGFLGSAASRLETRAGGYLLSVGPAEVDALEFTALAREGDAALRRGETQRAAEALVHALALWRGEVCEDVPPWGALTAEVLRLTEQRLRAAVQLGDAWLALGRHAELIGELRRLMVEQPLHERLHAQLMLALYRSGRQADAFTVYHVLRLRLIDELGVEPGGDLRRLYDRMLRGDFDGRDDPSPCHGRCGAESLLEAG
ncbi:AfsR/SARP family transcriptional regulator [Actinoallomurus purpureus]|uniref:AfsR/SARP family transcriptional regulator n=1 Tax=Actinoallomurus purpureus TaxID=478114 RepID=UPI002092277F|nr:AfsR/SARP family transcriptional regulator [Actinoallomurus purpureus]MCO6007556.1 AfsR/SARP family transcriptional regulator [Actinoallomurus purpureus]